LWRRIVGRVDQRQRVRAAVIRHCVVTIAAARSMETVPIAAW